MIAPGPEAQKRAAAVAAAAEVRPGMLVGLGTGSTAFFLVEELGRRVREKGLAIRTVATSRATAEQAAGLGMAPLEMGDVAAVDLCIDGVDQVDAALRAIKGGGGAMLREKIVAAAAARMIAIADASKIVGQLARAVPVEVLPFARASLLARVAALGGCPAVREGLSDQGNLLVDCDFGPVADPARLAAQLEAIPGMLGHGLFLAEIDALYVAGPEKVAVHERNASVTSL